VNPSPGGDPLCRKGSGEGEGRPAPGALDVVRAGLEDAASALAADGIPTPDWRGKLLRPLVAYAAVPPPRRRGLGPSFWFGAAAVQMVHEASLLHDDILDGAGSRRNGPTLSSHAGVGVALALGDHYLTGAYRSAVQVGSASFLERFIVAVEGTVAGERAQIEGMGRRVGEEAYEGIVRDKSGALFGAAVSLGGALASASEEELDAREGLGRDLGALYQRVDDLLDYCPSVERGKPPLQDFRQEKWTWVLGLVPGLGFDATARGVITRLFSPSPEGPSPVCRGLDDLRRREAGIVARIGGTDPGDDLLAGTMGAWVRAAERGVAIQERALGIVAPHGPERRALRGEAAFPHGGGFSPVAGASFPSRTER